ncbi:VpsR-related response regulator [Oceanimonas sp. GK1]|uniref:VpsR-related response regulator n=1 Tax=Oceanimonas sp. (strain GK1 / IBRC-M 10197) TaxID=511062 RepID=UPI0013053F45|nr:VpsR-related response regulator [Oceanimonas sp. GK1]
MFLEREILLLQCSSSKAVLTSLGDQFIHWSLARYSNLDSASAYLDSRETTVALLDCAGETEPTTTLKSFMNRYQGISWIALLSREQLSQKAWSLFVVNYCYDYHTTPVCGERLLVTLGRAYGMSELRNMLCLPMQKGEVVGKHEEFKKTLKKLYASNDGCLTLSGEAGVGKRFLARRWADTHNYSILDLVSLNLNSKNNDIHERLRFIKNRNNRVCFFVNDVVDLPEKVQWGICDFLSMNVEGCFFVFSCSMELQDVDRCNSVIPELISYLKREWICVPSLRHRGQDRLLLARYYLQKISTKWGKSILDFSPSAEDIILSYSWPGNVVELIDRITIGVSKCESDYLDASIMGLDDDFVIATHRDLSLRKAREKAEEYAIKRVLDMVPGRTGKAAELLCISTSSLHRLIARYGIRR